MNYKIFIWQFLLLLISTLLSSCSFERLARVGSGPELSNIDLSKNHEEFVMKDEFTQNKIKALENHAMKTNSLWQPGSLSFFRDNRAWRIGDIVKVVIEIQDTAKLSNSTQQNRTNQETLGLLSFFGKEKPINKYLNADPKNLINVNSAKNNQGLGNISRKEDVKTEVAAQVVQILSNGNLVIKGKQEVRVNYELREVTIAGIARPRDITTNNEIQLNQIAEARVSYGGKGTMSDLQKPRYGSEIIDAVSPF
jgi:flagellar L-ring protein precursor FlgH